MNRKPKENILLFNTNRTIKKLLEQYQQAYDETQKLITLDYLDKMIGKEMLNAELNGIPAPKEIVKAAMKLAEIEQELKNDDDVDENDLLINVDKAE